MVFRTLLFSSSTQLAIEHVSLRMSVSLDLSVFGDFLGTLERERDGDRDRDRLRKGPRTSSPTKTEETQSCVWIRHMSMGDKGRQCMESYY